jgi:uncharacterized protein involved in outer membrane biogenesis
VLAHNKWLRPDALGARPAFAHAQSVWKQAPAPTRWGAMTALFLAIALTIFLLVFDWNWFRGPIGRMASARLHRQVTLVGDLHVHIWSWQPKAEALDVRIAEPDWAKAQSLKEGRYGDMARIGKFAVQVKLLPLFRGQVILPLLEFDNADLRLRRQKDGQSNWTFSAKTEKNGAKLPPIQRLIINDGKLAINDDQHHIRFTGTVNSSEQASGDQRGAFRLAGDGTLNSEPFKARVSGAPLLNIAPDRPYPFDAEVISGPSHVLAHGDITRPFNLGNFQTQLDLRGPNLNRLYELTGLAFPNTPPYHLNGHLTRDKALWSIAGITGRVGDSDLNGALSVDASGKHPYLKANLLSRHLQWDDLMAVFGGPPSVAKGQSFTPEQKAMAMQMAAQHRILPDAPLDIKRIRAMNADVRYRALSVSDPHIPVRTADVTLNLKDGVLSGNPIRLGLSAGTVSGRATLNATHDTPFTDVNLTLGGGRLESLVPIKSGGKPAIEGALGAHIALKGAGNSVRKAAAASDGTFSVAVPGGQMRQAFAELLGINASKGLLLLLAKNQNETPLRCAVADFTVTNGVMRADRIVIDTGVVLAGGSGTINLGSEQMDLKIEGHSKKVRLVRLLAPITLKGPLSGPKIGVDTSKILGQGGVGVAIGALVNPLAAILPFLSGGGAKDADCGALLAQAHHDGAPIRR